MPSFKAETCYGVAKACVFVPEGNCDRIVGGSKTAAS